MPGKPEFRPSPLLKVTWCSIKEGQARRVTISFGNPVTLLLPLVCSPYLAALRKGAKMVLNILLGH